MCLILKKEKADFQFISASENNAWLLNIRGRDTKYTPIPHSFILVNKFKEVKFFCNLRKISPLLKKQLKKIHFENINFLEKELLDIRKKKFIIDKNTCSFFYEKVILKNNKVLDFQDPIYLLKQ